MKASEANFYQHKMLAPRERVDFDNLKADMAAEKEHSSELEEALIELAELFAEQDDALVELAEIIGGEF